MNIFWLDYNPEVSAQYHCDKHVVKMVLEACQLLCTAHHHYGKFHGYSVDKGALYRSSHDNHPCAIYTQSSLPAYFAVLDYARCLSEEYQYRYGKFHNCDNLIDGVLNTPPVGLPKFETMAPPQCMPDIYKDDCLVTAYRNYYRGDKTHIFRWSRRPIPEWIKHEAA